MVALVLVGCSGVEASEPTLLTSTSTTTLEPTEPASPPPTATVSPTETPVPIMIEEREQIRAIMQEYGRVYEQQLSDAYWERIERRIAQYGTARRIVPLEFHGDTYRMYDGMYAMDPEQFEIQMRYLMENDFHFVTGAEMVGFLEGWLDLPARSIILTTDSGARSGESFARITALFRTLEADGYAPHMNSFIWTRGMSEAENDNCRGDACWEVFRVAIKTGYFSIGTHSESHGDLASYSDPGLSWDINTSKEKIHEALGVNVFGMAWPLESCPTNTKLVADLGIRFGFGGWTRAGSQLFVYSRDNMPGCLPRLFPPNPGGLSGRPMGLTLAEMLEEALKDVPLK